MPAEIRAYTSDNVNRVKVSGVGQRGFIGLMTIVVLLLFGAVLGRPGAFPEVDGTTITPEYLGQLLGQILVPLGLLYTTFVNLFKAINARVHDPTDPFQPGDLLPLVTSKEFITYVIALIVSLGQIFGVTLLSPEQQTLYVNMILGVIAALMGTWGYRPSGSVVTPVAVDIEAKVETPV